jgi:glycosyltransferase involved in cell wall biosynthesis
MKTIVVHDYCGHPFQIDLSKQLAKNGYRVYHIYTSISGGPKGDLTNIDNLEVVDLGKDEEPVQKESLFKRRTQEKNYGKKLVQFVKGLNPDIIFSANTPLEAQRQIVEWANLNKTPFVFWLQDIISMAANSILKKKNRLLAKIVWEYFSRIEKKALRNSQHIITISEDFDTVLLDWGISSDKIITIPNWAPIDQIPVVEKRNKFSEKFGLVDSFNVIYSGTLGMKHNPQIISDAAEKLRDNNEIKIVVITQGAGMDYLKAEKSSKSLDNLLLLPFQPFEDLPKVLGSADLLLTLLEKEAGVFSVPSKVWSSYCAGRASLLVVPEDNLSAKITKRNKTGIVLSLNESGELHEKINKYYNEQDSLKELGINARTFAEENFRVEKIALRFQKVIESLTY